jgi:hypothetical protein
MYLSQKQKQAKVKELCGIPFLKSYNFYIMFTQIFDFVKRFLENEKYTDEFYACYM